jgi:hypothetical protein
MKKNQRNAEPDKIQLNLIIDWLLSLRVFGAKIKSRQIIIPILTNTGIKHFNKTGANVPIECKIKKIFNQGHDGTRTTYQYLNLQTSYTY